MSIELHPSFLWVHRPPYYFRRCWLFKMQRTDSVVHVPRRTLHSGSLPTESLLPRSTYWYKPSVFLDFDDDELINVIRILQLLLTYRKFE